MNVYDQAHSLVTAIKGSEEYKRYVAAEEKVNSNEALSAMLKDYRQKQMELQRKQMTGEMDQQDLMNAAQEIYTIMVQDPTTADFLQCEMRFTMMMQDVYKIIGDVIDIEKMLG